MADPFSQIEAGVEQGLAELFDNASVVAVLGRRGGDELFEAGRRAVQLAVSPIVWSERLGPMLDTAQVCKWLGVTRQAVAKAVDTGRLMALPAGKYRRFPAWQFSFANKTAIRGEVAELLAAFREVYPDIRPLQIASWAMTAQPELAGSTPAAWLTEAGAVEPLLDAARRTAVALAQ